MGDWHNLKKWQVLRDIIKKENDCRCCVCGSRDRVEVDHVLTYDREELSEERKRVLFADPRNLWTLCARCHRIKTRKIDPWVRVRGVKALKDIPQVKHLTAEVLK